MDAFDALCDADGSSSFDAQLLLLNDYEENRSVENTIRHTNRRLHSFYKFRTNADAQYGTQLLLCCDFFFAVSQSREFSIDFVWNT
jgi:hypothetical protein